MGGFDTRTNPMPLRAMRSYDGPSGTWYTPFGVWTNGLATCEAGYVHSYRSSPLLLDSFGADAPVVDGSLGKRLAGHLSFYQRLGQALVSEASSQTFTTKGGQRYDSIDLGHDFTSLQLRGRQSWFRRRTVVKRNGRLWTGTYEVKGMATGQRIPAFVRNYANLSGQLGYFSSIAGSRTGFPFAEARDLLTQLVPKTGGLGETLLSLLSLRLPSLLSDLRHQMVLATKRASAKQKAEISGLRAQILTGNIKGTSKTRLRAAGFILRESREGQRILNLLGKPSKRSWVRAVGSDYLEVVFGLLPVIEVLLDIQSGFAEAEDRIYGRSFRRRRRRILSDTVTTVPIDLSGPHIKGGPVNTAVLPLLQEVRVVESLQVTARATSHGRMGFLQKEALSGEGQGSLAAIIRRTGLLTPTLGWEILPYSWLVDWLVNFTQGIKRREFFQDAYPIDYAYATYVCEVTAKPVATQSKSASDATFDVTDVITPFETRLRFVARRRLDPFGSPFTATNVDGYKAAVLAALGLSNIR